MKKNDPFSPISDLIGTVGFKDQDELGSFCLAVGLFHDRIPKDEPEPPRRWDPSNYNIWPLVQVISYTLDPTIEDIRAMKDLLYPYLISGIEIVEEKVRGKKGIDALRSISELIPP